MKKYHLLALLLITILSVSSCKKAEKETVTTPVEKAEDEIDNTATSPDTTVIPQPENTVQDEGQITVKGTVTAINMGKDGYTATVETIEGKSYQATISIPNLKDPKEYRNVEKGETIKVVGKIYGDDKIIKVEKLY